MENGNYQGTTSSHSQNIWKDRGWSATHPLEFEHMEFGTVYRTEQADWIQVHPEDGQRTLKSGTAKLALAEAEGPYKKKRASRKKVAETRPKKKTGAKRAAAKKPTKKAARGKKKTTS